MVVLFITFGMLYHEIDLYQKNQEIYRFTERFYQGKIMAKITFSKVNSESVPKGKGDVQFNVGKVSYEKTSTKVSLAVYVNGELLFTENETTKKPVL